MSLAADILKANFLDAREPRYQPPKKERNQPTKFKPVSSSQVRERWNKEQDAPLEELIKTHSASDIAIEMNRSRTGVMKRINRLGLEVKFTKKSGWIKWESRLLKRAKELYEQKEPELSYKQIGEVMGITENQVRGMCIRMGCSSRHHKWTITEEVLVAKHYKTVDAKIIADVLGIKESSVKAKHVRLTNKRLIAGRAAMLLSRDVVLERLRGINQ